MRCGMKPPLPHAQFIRACAREIFTVAACAPTHHFTVSVVQFPPKTSIMARKLWTYWTPRS